jgi:hypothetical protein
LCRAPQDGRPRDTQRHSVDPATTTRRQAPTRERLTRDPSNVSFVTAKSLGGLSRIVVNECMKRWLVSDPLPSLDTAAPDTDAAAPGHPYCGTRPPTPRHQATHAAAPGHPRCGTRPPTLRHQARDAAAHGQAGGGPAPRMQLTRRWCRCAGGAG